MRYSLALLIIPSLAHADDSEMYNRVVETVVWVIATDGSGNPTHGTGVVVQGGILTAHHVVKGRKVCVVFPARDGAGRVIAEAAHYSRLHQPCGVVFADPARDMALLRMVTPAPTRAATLSARSAAPGEHVFSIGGDGEGLWRYTDGGVRQGRSQAHGRSAGVRYVESSLPLNDGDSGGALFNSHGEVVAIHSSSSRKLSLVNQSVDVAEIRAFLKAAGEKGGVR